MGKNALRINTTGFGNTAIGLAALDSNNGNDNTAVGDQALVANTTGTGNVAMGTVTLDNNTTGSNNTALGKRGLYDNTTGSNNTAVGYYSSYNNTAASNNTAVGTRAGFTNSLSANNVFVGYEAGYTHNRGSATNSYNTYLGYYAGRNSTTGVENTFVGGLAGEDMTTGSKNTILGRYNGNQGGLDIRTASNNVVLSDGDGDVHFRSQPSLEASGYKIAKLPRGVMIGAGSADVSASSISVGTDNDQNAAIRWTLKTNQSGWNTGHLFFTVSSCDGDASDNVAAWYFYKFMTYNEGISGLSLIDSGGNTGSFSLNISDQGDSTQYADSLIFDLSWSGPSGNDSTIAHAQMTHYAGIYETWRVSS